MAKYGIISDTHFTKETDSKSLDFVFNQLVQIFHDVDTIIHAGDISNNFFLEKLSNIAPTKAIAGESDNIKDLP